MAISRVSKWNREDRGGGGGSIDDWKERETGKASGDARMREGKKHEDAHLLGRNTCERQSATSSAESVRRNKSTRPPFHVDTRPEPYYLWAFVSVGNSSETCRADTSLPDVWPLWIRVIATPVITWFQGITVDR